MTLLNPTSKIRDCDFACVTNLISLLINDMNNNNLTRPFTILGFKKALFQMHLDKSSGLIGLKSNRLIFKKFQHHCVMEIFHSGITWLDGAMISTQVISTNIVLIPKVDNPMSMRDLRPIALCNVIIKSFQRC